MRRLPLFVLLLLLLLPPASRALAQEAPAPAGRPKVCVALSGGGAKGIAHIGVLRVLEELNIPIDCITGTSMGAIVGGLYASGLGVDELEKAVLAIDWADALEDRPRREDLSYRRKEEDRLYLADLEFGLVDGRFRAPGGLRAGQKLVFILRSLTLPVSGVRDFDRLPIPFRAVATDAATGDMVVLGQGDLVWALRASMAIPGVFSPVELDGRILVDGGVSNNIPVDVARALGADVVIAVDIADSLESNEKLTSLLSITWQTIGLLTRKNMEPRLAEADLVLRPEKVDAYGLLQFDAGPEILRLGFEEARARAAELRRWSAPAPLRRAPRPALVDRPITAVRIEGAETVDERVIAARLRARPGQALDLRQIAADVADIYGLGDFERVDFRLDETGGGRELVVRVREKPWGPNYLRGGLLAGSDLEGAIELSLLLSFTATRLNARGGEWRNELLLGSDRGLSSELYQPLGFRGRWFAAPGFRLGARQTRLYAAGREAAELETQTAQATLDIGYAAGKYGEARLGLIRGWGDAELETGEIPGGEEPGADLDDLRLGGWTLQGTVDRLDSVTFPRHGGFAQLRLLRAEEALGSRDSYTRLELGAAHYRSRGRGTFSLGLQAGLSPGSELPVYDRFSIGGPLRLGGFAEGELRGDSYAIARAGWRHRIFDKVHAGALAELGNAWGPEARPSFGDTLFSASLLLGADTFLGPVYLSYSQAEEGDGRLSLHLGRIF